ncbi:MAG: NAD(P)-dependent oxidoreductase [Pseudomonadales bacterium]|jgi:UDP-glucose 4-epimerase|nr:NAD(P)-dependent oxidoreductase [Pseudomonadales bacterium]
MKTLVTGSAGRLGAALVRRLRAAGEAVIGIDVEASPTTDQVASVTDRTRLRTLLTGVDAVLHTATLHKPQVATHSRQQFIDTNVSGTLALLEAAVDARVGSFVFTSTTSIFGQALRAGPDQAAVWVTEDLAPVPRNIYGVTKTAAEQLCELIHRREGLPVLILRTSRFFAEIDDDEARQAAMDDGNLKVVEYLHRRVDIEDVVEAHLLARSRAAALAFDRFIVSATTPFEREDAQALRQSLPGLIERRLPGILARLEALGWRLPQGIDRIYDNGRARDRLGWAPKHDFETVLTRVEQTGRWRGPLA